MIFSISLNWGETTTNNYGFAPAEGGGPERFQLQLYGELLKLLNVSPVESGFERVVEISCGRGGGLHHLARRLPPSTRLIGLGFLGACDRLLPATVCVGGQSLLRAWERAPVALQRACDRRRRERRGVARLWRRCGLSARGGAGPGASAAGSSMRITAPVARCACWSSWRAPPGSEGAARHHAKRGQRLRARRRATPGPHPHRRALESPPPVFGTVRALLISRRCPRHRSAISHLETMI